MPVRQITSFDSVSQRAIYCLCLIYSEFVPVLSDDVSELSQRKLHGLMKQMIDRLYANPGMLNLPDDRDEAFQWYELNNMKPDLDRIYQSAFKGIYEFYRFLYISALHGEQKDNCLLVSNAVLKQNKVSHRQQFHKLLSEIGIDVSKGKTETAVIADGDILCSLKLLARQVPVDVNPWTPFALLNFACCLYKNDYRYLLSRVDGINGLNGLLFELQKRCIEKGYEQSISCSMGASGIDFSIYFKTKVGGFVIAFNPRKVQPFGYGTINGVGEKAMLEDFVNLSCDLQKHFMTICRKCNGCQGCTKGGKNQIFACHVTYEGKDYSLCPCFPRHGWDTIDHDLIDILFTYHEAQEKYGVNRKKQ